ncbi:MAG: hypothetical protein ACI4RC_04325 [Oscillospiraceae bacterium]
MYIKNNWKIGDTITKEKINNMEGGIESAHNKADSNALQIQKNNGNIAALHNVMDIVDETINPQNWFDKSNLTVNNNIGTSGEGTTSTVYSVTDYIPAKVGDVIVCGSTSNVNSACTFRNVTYVAEYDKDKNFLVRSNQFPFTKSENNVYTYTVQNENTEFIRISDNNSAINTDGVYYTIAINYNTALKLYYTDYFDPYVETKSLELDNIKSKINDFNSVSSAVIDCWGDSMTEGGSSGKTYPQFLSELLGSDYTVNNYGKSSQSSGEIAMRFGTNEIYVTLEGNKIPSSTEPVKISSIVSTHGDRWTGRNLINFSPSRPVPCRLMGIKGQFSKTGMSAIFTRDTEGDAVDVPPESRVWCEPNNSDGNICIFWAGKNDTAFADKYIVDGTVDCIYSMTQRMQHKKFIVLPVFKSLSQTKGTTGYSNITKINNKLSGLYPNNYLDIQSMLIEHGMEDGNLTPTEDDTTAIANDTLPPQLMASDGTHPNETCREIFAKYIYDFILEKGWI